jgi:hypothetical protein
MKYYYVTYSTNCSKQFGWTLYKTEKEFSFVAVMNSLEQDCNSDCKFTLTNVIEITRDQYSELECPA